MRRTVLHLGFVFRLAGPSSMYITNYKRGLLPLLFVDPRKDFQRDTNYREVRRILLLLWLVVFIVPIKSWLHACVIPPSFS